MSSEAGHSAGTRGSARTVGTARTAATKQRLFEAAMELIGQRGTDGVTVDEIAAAAGVAKGTVYYNFGSKNELVEQLLGHGMGLLMERLLADDATDRSTSGRDVATRRARSGHASSHSPGQSRDEARAGEARTGEKQDDDGASSSSDPLAEARGMIGRALAFIAEYPAFVRLWLGEQWRADGAWQGLLAGMRAEVLAAIEAAVRRVAAERPLRAGVTPEGIAVALFGAAFVTGMDRAAFHRARSLEEATEAVLSLVLGALDPEDP